MPTFHQLLPRQAQFVGGDSACCQTHYRGGGGRESTVSIECYEASVFYVEIQIIVGTV